MGGLPEVKEVKELLLPAEDQTRHFSGRANARSATQTSSALKMTIRALTLARCEERRGGTVMPRLSYKDNRTVRVAFLPTGES